MRLRSLVWVGVWSALAAVAVPPTHAEIRLPKLISDHAVLQRGVPIRVWGWSSPGARVNVSLHTQHVPATADALGQWTVWLMPETAGGPYTLEVKGDGSEGEKQVSDIMVGDVWFASGQSNMEFPLTGFPGAPMKDSKAEIAAASHPELRLLVVEKKGSTYPLDDLSTTWTTCTPETAAKFSAVAYFFGRAIAADQHVTVGLIDSTWGGTPADSWVSMNALGADPQLLPAFASRAQFASDLAEAPAEQSADKMSRAAGKPPLHDWYPNEMSYLPAGLYNGMVAPATKYTIKGILWYQGETNSQPDRAPYYTTLFQALIEDWRTQFAQGQLPFLFVQIASFDGGPFWGTVRDAQRRALDLTRTAMTVTLDIGEAKNVHPPDKQTVGARLALAARAIAYGEDVEYSSPLFREATTEPDGGMRVWFDHAHGLSSHGQPVTGFEVAGADHHFQPAEATIVGDTVEVKSASVTTPEFVRYAWAGVVTANLYNRAGLPAGTFTSEPANEVGRR